MRKIDRQSPGAIVRCAIYTRKSSDEGLEQEFNSLDAQREACEAYIISQRHAGWLAVPDMYDDGGLSGGTMNRPALQRLLDAIEAGKVQIVVVYKVDRLTRSLADFAKIVDVLDVHDASFVSVTQQFNTTTSMGRLTLNMLLSFAQFEREIASERIRDKIAASKAKGMWMGGNVPLGYDAVDRKLVVNEAEAETVRTIFRQYAALGSVQLLRADLDQRGIVSKRREGAGGTLAGGNRFSRGALYTLLQNRIYRGEIAHQGKVYPGRQDRIVDEELWVEVQDKLTSNRRDRPLAAGAQTPSLLAGIIFDPGGQPMSATHARKKGKRYRYYVSASLIDNDAESNPRALRVPAGEIESLVLDRLHGLLSARGDIADVIAPLNLDARVIEKFLASAEAMNKSWCQSSTIEQRKFVQTIVNRVFVGTDAIEIEIDRDAIATALSGESIEDADGAGAFPLTVKAALTRAGKGKRLIIEAEGPGVDPALNKLLREAFALRRKVLEERQDDADSRSWSSTYRARRIALLRLSYLAPKVVRAILQGQQPPALSPKRLTALSRKLPLNWADQPAYLGFREG